jgi:hypothetical protein
MKPETWVALCGVIAAILVGIATIIAIVRGPIVALRIQRAIEDERATKNRKLWIFKTLMSNRATRMAPVFVQALNLIDVEFTAASEKPVRDAWKEAQDHFSDWGKQTPEQKQTQAKANLDRADELLSEMLVRMGTTLGYSFDKVYVKKGWYYPEGLGDMEQEGHALRKGLLRIISGYGAFPVAVFEQKFPPITTAAQPPKAVILPEEPKRLND